MTINQPMYAVVSADMEQTSVLNAGFNPCKQDKKHGKLNRLA